MSAPFLWIILPGLLAGGFLLIQPREKLVIGLGTLAAFLLALLAWAAPIGGALRLGPLAIEVGESITFLGRSFVLESSDRPILVLIYLGLAFWFAGAWAARPGALFVPVGLAINSLLTAALAVDPLLYAGLLILMAVLISIPLFVPPGASTGRGVMRFLTFQTLGMPFLLFTGWLLDSAQAAEGASAASASAGLLIGLGFAFLLAIFPFHTWIPMLGEETHPYVAAFVFFVLPLSISLFALGFLEQYPWLQEAPGIYAYLRVTGMLMVVTSGVWAAVQRHLGRVLGYAAAFEIGISLLAISLAVGPEADPDLLGVFFTALLPREIALGIAALGLYKIRERYPDPAFPAVQGAARQLPVASAALVIALLTLSGFPLLAGFPVRLALWQGLAGQFPLGLMAALVGSAGLLMGSLRILAGLLIGREEERWVISETRLERGFLAAGILFLLLVGLLPQFFLPFFAGMGAAFPAIGP
jgi:formate hydrogenlyase subunit 3/multisubunit Na+/H+ antiporter MnhD subunit